MIIDTVTVHKMGYFDFESCVERVYGRSPEFIASLESSNDTAYEFIVDGTPMNEWDQTNYVAWINGNRATINPLILLNDLSRRGHIPTGRYIVNVSW